MKDQFKNTSYKHELTGITYMGVRDTDGKLIDRRVIKNGLDRVIDTHTPSVGYTSSKYKRKGDQ